MQKIVEQKFTQSLSKCQICFKPYDRHQHVPLIICTRHHTLCRPCLDVMEKKTYCPYCREQVKFHKVMVNEYIYELLPQRETMAVQKLIQDDQKNTKINIALNPNIAPNCTMNVIPYSIQQSLINTTSHTRNTTTHHPNYTLNPASINTRQPSYPYPQHHDTTFQLEEEDDEELGEKMFRHRVASFYLTYLQFPFAVVNIVIVLYYPYSQCMDFAHGLEFMVNRPWFLGVGVVQLLLMVSIIITNALLTKGYMTLSENLEWGDRIMDVALAKALIWGLVELALYAETIVPYCSSKMIIYGGIVALLHVVVLFVYLFGHKSTIPNYIDN